ncbi:MAG: choice-of-anchor Q domain-containing protein [Dokdonella sp.]
MYRSVVSKGFGLVVIVVAGPAIASTSCVSTAGGIQSALDIAQTNGQDDTINIVGGSYSLSAELDFSSSEAHNLVVEGGWNAGCTSRSGVETQLNGQNLVTVLDVFNANGSIDLEHLTFAAGRSTAPLAAPISVSSNTGDVAVRLCQFLGNRSTEGSGALTAYTGSGHLYLANNLVVANHGALLGAVFLSQDAGEGYVTGNTIVANATDTADMPGGLGIGGNGHFTLTNNILWNNAGTNAYDFQANAAHSRFNNDIGVLGNGVAADQVVAEQYVDPQFVACPGILCLSFELGGQSPLIDAGFDTPLGGQPALDLNGKPRQLGLHVDIGAYESEEIFADDFD